MTPKRGFTPPKGRPTPSRRGSQRILAEQASKAWRLQ